MGTIMNGKKWIGAYVNGDAVSGLVKNGVVFYKKEIPTPSVYKRRIMVGDNLKGKTIYSDFPNNYVNYFSNIFDNIKTNIISIERPDIQYNIVENIEYYESDITLSIDGNNSSIGLISAIYVGNTIFGDLINDSMVDFRNDSDYIVSLIQSDNSSYRHLYIEDSNIRPLKVGDKITTGTRFYFNFPDNFADEVGWDESIEYRIETTDGDTLFVISGVGTVIGSTVFTMIVYSDANSPMGFFGNESSAEATDLGNVEVGSIQGPYFNKYIMVDKTTLGA